MQVAKSLGLIHDIQIKPVSIDNCPFSLNLTDPFSHIDDEPKLVFVRTFTSHLQYNLYKYMFVD